LKNAEVGEIVAPFASSASSKGSVVTLADMSSLEVEADVSESNINKVTIGQPCEIILDAYPTVKYPGAVKKIVPTADRSRATVQTKVQFTKLDARVLPEMSARVNFLEHAATAESNAAAMLAVPKDAVTTRDGNKVVFRIDGELVTSVPVTTGREIGRLIEISSGLSEGQRVVLSPPGKLTTGQKIELSS
jgi:HlyD family secretion protein